MSEIPCHAVKFTQEDSVVAIPAKLGLARMDKRVSQEDRTDLLENVFCKSMNLLDPSEQNRRNHRLLHIQFNLKQSDQRDQRIQGKVGLTGKGEKREKWKSLN